MKKIYKALTDEQKNRGVIFSSQLRPGTTIHEVLDSDKDKHEIIRRLMDDKFFNGSQFNRNEIRR